MALCLIFPIPFSGWPLPWAAWLIRTVFFFPDLETYAQSAAAKEEIFGPIIPLVSYRDLNAVIAFIKTREKPLAMYAFTDQEMAAQGGWGQVWLIWEI